MSAVPLIGPGATPTVYKRSSLLQGAHAAGVAYAVQRLPADPAGVFALTLRGVVVGSAIQIESQDGTPFSNSIAVSSTPAFLLTAYALGSPLNELRIKVRKGSASPFYRPFETETTAVVGTQTIFVSQIPDE